MISLTRRLLAAALFLLCLVAAAAEQESAPAGQAPHPVTLDDIDKVKWASRPRLSPDGRQVVYSVDGVIYVVPATGGKPRAVTSAGSTASDPQWSRDGRSLYFLSDRVDKKYQLWKLPVDSFGEATQLTTFERGVD